MHLLHSTAVEVLVVLGNWLAGYVHYYPEPVSVQDPDPDPA